MAPTPSRVGYPSSWSGGIVGTPAATLNDRDAEALLEHKATLACTTIRFFHQYIEKKAGHLVIGDECIGAFQGRPALITNIEGGTATNCR
jgi:hypothetical protein